MFKSLYSKLAAVLTILFILVGLFFVGVTIFSTEMYQQEVNQRLNNKLAEQIVSQRLLIKENRINKEALEEIFHMLMVINPNIEVYLLNPEGKILAYSAPPSKVQRQRVNVEPIQRLLDDTVTIPFVGDDPRNPEGKKVFTAARIPQHGNLEGYLYVILGGEAYDNVVQKLKGSYILQLSGWMIAASLFFALISGLILFALLTKRLKRLARVVGEYNVDDALLPTHLPAKAADAKGDEINQLTLTFKKMSERIRDQMEKLRKSDAMRSELITNVSHDLRTPLSTLQGYLETLLLKENSLLKEEKRDYLETAIRHCKRLDHLVSELLELAKLESHEITLHSESFNLIELVHDVIQKYHLKAKEKGIRLITPSTKGLPFVTGDIGLIERVMENLLENAIYYTPRGGSVALMLNPQKESISFQITDTGQGIPAKDLPNIFERFSRLDKSRTGESNHSGLGLAITKKILELHNSVITVDSVLGTGTTFTFQLPLHRPA